ncbi:MAG: hypothetical protein M3R15_01155, partial [Acidobacteriota bacterium]|nr:hypothetical protein [Acidobacteriota bacterium]
MSTQTTGEPRTDEHTTEHTTRRTVETSDDGRTEAYAESTEIHGTREGSSFALNRNRWLIGGAAVLVIAVLIYAFFFRRVAPVETAEAPAAASTGTVKFLM